MVEAPERVRGPIFAILAFSLAAVGAIGAILLIPRESAAADVSFLPPLNATLNAAAATCIVLGVVFIKRGNVRLHQSMMTAAFSFSALFLCGYLTYHSLHGDTPYPKLAPHRPLYLSVLASHVLLSIVSLPLTLTALFFAWTKRFPAHKKVVRFAMPIWLYVSVTGVIVFFMLDATKHYR